MGRGLHRHFLAQRVTRPYEFDKFEPPKTPYWADAEFLIALCGEESRVGSWGTERFLEEPKHVTCPQCRTKLSRAALKERPADAPKLQLVQAKDARGGFRNHQGWQALVDGEAVAIVGFEEHKWRIYPFVARKNEETGRLEVINTHGVLLEDNTTGSRFSSAGYRLPSKALGWLTKEDALMGCEPLRASGVLKTEPELLAEYLENQRVHAQWISERDRKVVALDQKNRETLEALREVLEKETLSNFQRQGIMTAIEHYESKVKPLVEATT